MYERYVELKKIHGVKDADVARETGISKSTLSDWKAGRAVPKADKLEKIAAFFGVTMEYLVKGDAGLDDPFSNPKLQAHIDKYQRLDEKDQEKTDSYMDGLLANEKYSAKEGSSAGAGA